MRASVSGFIYEAKWWNQNQNPATNSGGDGPWRQIGPCVAPGPTPNPGQGFAQVVSQTQFNQMFPNRNPFYTYQGLLDAAATFPAFAGTGDLAMRRREAAAAMANFAHETGGLVHVTEIARGLYCSNSATPCGVCAPGQSYYGRGPIQLSWNFNYCSAGQALGLNLWANPNLVEQNSAIAWRTAFWYWMTQNGPGTQPAHNCIINNAGFGCTIRSINGALECNGGNPAQVQSRINNFNLFKAIIGATSVGPDGC
jgi:predicted chitinase